jgi:hypothetical protein
MAIGALYGRALGIIVEVWQKNYPKLSFSPPVKQTSPVSRRAPMLLLVPHPLWWCHAHDSLHCRDYV